jgi:hypothetical protein
MTNGIEHHNGNGRYAPVEAGAPAPASVKILQFPSFSSPEVLAQRFHDAVEAARAFSYMGVLFGEDYLGRYVSKVYLNLNAPTPDLTPEQERGVADVQAIFNALASSLEDRLGSSLHLIEPLGGTPDWLRQELQRIAQQSKLQLVYEQPL